MRQIARRIVLAAVMASVANVACDDTNDDGTTTGANNVGASGTDAGTTSGNGGDTGETADAGSSGSSSGRDGGASRDDTGEDATSASDGRAASEDAGDAAPEVKLTDPQIGAVTTAANNGEVMQANAALPKLTDADAKAFAQEMIMAHTAAQMRQMALLQSKNITPVENPVSMQLRQDSDMIVMQLTAAMQDVDRLYMQTQVTVHTKVLDSLENILIPSAEDPDLKAELEATRDDVQSHLDHAQQILDALQR